MGNIECLPCNGICEFFNVEGGSFGNLYHTILGVIINVELRLFNKTFEGNINIVTE